MGLMQINARQKTIISSIYKTIQINWKDESAILIAAMISFLAEFKIQTYVEFENKINQSLAENTDIAAKAIIYTQLNNIVNTLLLKETEVKSLITLVQENFMINKNDDIAFLIDYIYLKEAQNIKRRNSGIVFTPPSISSFINTYINEIKWGKTELSVIDICAGTGLLSSQIRPKNGSLTLQELDSVNLTVLFLKCEISQKKAYLRGGDYFQYYSKTTEKFDVGVCNPPYYNRILKTPDELKFISKLCEQVHGIVFAVIPLSCLTAIKDRYLLNQIKKNYEILSIFRFANDTFHAASVETILLVIDTRPNMTVYENEKNEQKVYIDPVYENISHINFKHNNNNIEDNNGWMNWLNNFDFTAHFKKRTQETITKSPHIYCEMLNDEFDTNNRYGLTQYLNFEDLFEVMRGGSGVRERIDKSKNNAPINVIGASKYNQGLLYTTKKYHERDVYEGGNITISKFYGATFIQEKQFIASKDVLVLVPNKKFLSLNNQGLYTFEMFAEQINELLCESSYFNKISINKLKTLPILIRGEHRYLYPAAKNDINEVLQRIITFIRMDPKGALEEVALSLHLYSDDDEFKRVKKELLEGLIAAGSIYEVNEDSTDQDVQYSLDFLSHIGLIKPLAEGEEVVRVINYYFDNLQTKLPLYTKT